MLNQKTYLLWGLQLGNEKGPKSVRFQKTLYVSKLKHSLYASFRGAQSLIYIVAWSLMRNLHKNVENEQPKKTYGAIDRICTTSLESKRFSF